MSDAQTARLRALVVSGIWPPEVGGPASHAAAFGAYLQNRAHEVRAVTSAEGAVDQPSFPLVIARRDRLRLVRLAEAGALIARHARWANVLYATGLYSRAAAASAMTRRPLVVKLVNDPAYERARNLGLFQGTLEEFQTEHRSVRLRALCRLRDTTLARARMVVVPSSYLGSIAAGWGLPRSRLTVVPNPVPEPLPRNRDELRARLGLSRPTVVFAGRFVPQKNLPVLLDSIEQLEHVAFVLIGDGPERQMVQARLGRSAIGSRVRLLSSLPRSEVLDWFCAADAAVLSSDWENMPHAVLEALSVGTPVVATNVGGVSEVVTHDTNGLLVPPERPDELARAISRVVEPETHLRLSAAAKDSVSQLHEASIFRTLEDVVGAAAGVNTSAR